MIRHYPEHAANERTFLAWLRTGLATAAFGFVIEKFNLFLALVAHQSVRPLPSGWFERIFTPFGRYDGVALIVVGVAIMAMGSVRYMRLEREIDRDEIRNAVGTNAELVVSAILALLVGALGVYAALQTALP